MYVDSIKTMNTRQTVNGSPSPSSPSVQAPKTDASVETGKKTKSTDGDLGKQIQIAKDGDEAYTLSIVADDKLVDSQRNVDLERLRKIMEQVTATLPHSAAKFGIHEKTKRVTIKLVDKDTQEVIKEFPPEKSLDLLAKGMELAGVLLDEKM